MGRASRPRPKHLHRKLKSIRESLGYTHAQMAKALECAHPGYVYGFENNLREPTLLTLVRYAELANCPADYLINDQLELPYKR